MPQPRVEDSVLLDTLAEVFRQYGFEGASLSRMTEATGLQRASLYHRFPDGKDQMAAAVIERINGVFAEHVLAPLGGAGDIAGRVRETARRIGQFYASGAKSCVLDTLSLGAGQTPLRLKIAESFEELLGALTTAAREAGAATPEARRRAEQAVIQIQGSLVLARATGQRGPFERILRDLPALLCGPA